MNNYPQPPPHMLQQSYGQTSISSSRVATIPQQQQQQQQQQQMQASQGQFKQHPKQSHHQQGQVQAYSINQQVGAPVREGSLRPSTSKQSLNNTAGTNQNLIANSSSRVMFQNGQNVGLQQGSHILSPQHQITDYPTEYRKLQEQYGVLQAQFDKEKRHAEQLEQKMKLVILENDKLHEGITTSDHGRSTGYDSPDRYNQPSAQSRRVNNDNSDLVRKVEEQKAELEMLRRERQMQKNAEADFEQMSAILEERCQLLLDENQNLQDLLTKTQESQNLQSSFANDYSGLTTSTAIGSGIVGSAEEWQRLKERVKHFEEQQQPLEDRQKALKGQNANLLKKIELLESSVKDYQQQIQFIQSTREVQMQNEIKSVGEKERQELALIQSRIDREKLEKVNQQLMTELTSLRFEKQKSSEVAISHQNDEVRLLQLQSTLVDLEQKLLKQSTRLQEREDQLSLTTAQLQESNQRVIVLEAQIVSTQERLMDDLRRTLSSQSDEQKRQHEEERQKLMQQRSEEFAALEKKHTTLRQSYIALEMENKQIAVMKNKLQELETVKSELLSEKSVFFQEKGTFLIQQKQREETYQSGLSEKTREISQLKERINNLGKEIEVLQKSKKEQAKVIEKAEKALLQNKQEEARLQQNIVSLTNELSQLKGAHVLLQADHEKVTEAHKKLVREHERTIANNAKETAASAKEFANQKQQSDLVNSALDSLKQQHSHSVKEGERLSKELQKWKSTSEQLQVQLEKSQKELQAKTTLSESVQGQLDKLLKELSGSTSQSEALAIRLRKSEENVNNLESSLNRVNLVLQKTETLLKESQNSFQSEEARHSNTTVLLKKAETSLQSTQQSLSSTASKLSKTEDNLKKVEESLRKTDASLKAEQVKVASYEETIRKEGVEKQQMEELVVEKFTEKKTQVKGLEDQVASLKATIATLQAQIDEQTRSRISVEGKLKETKESSDDSAKQSKREIERITSELKVVSARAAKLDHEVATLKESLAASQAEGVQTKEKLAKSETHVQKAILELTRMDDEKTAIADRNVQLDSQIAQLEAQYGEASAKIAQIQSELSDTIKLAKERRGKDQKEYNRKLQVMQNQVFDLEKSKKETIASFNLQVKDNMDQLQKSIKLYQAKIEELEKAGEKSAKQAKLELNAALANNTSRIHRSDAEKQEILRENALLNEILTDNQGKFAQMELQISQLNSQVDGLKVISDAKKTEIIQLQSILRQRTAPSANSKVVKKKPQQPQSQQQQNQTLNSDSAAAQHTNQSDGATGEEGKQQQAQA